MCNSRMQDVFDDTLESSNYLSILQLLCYNGYDDHLPHSPTGSIKDPRIIVDSFDSTAVDETRMFFCTTVNVSENIRKLLNSQFLMNLQKSSVWKLHISSMIYEYLKYVIAQKVLSKQNTVTVEVVENLLTTGKIILLHEEHGVHLPDLRYEDKVLVVFLFSWDIYQQIHLMTYSKRKLNQKPGPVLTNDWEEVDCNYIGNPYPFPEADFACCDDNEWLRYFRFLQVLEDIRADIQNNLVIHCKVVFASTITDHLKHLLYLKRLYDVTSYKVHVSPEFDEFVKAALPFMRNVFTSETSPTACKFHYDCSKFGRESHGPTVFHGSSVLKMAEIRVGFLDEQVPGESCKNIIFFLPAIY